MQLFDTITLGDANVTRDGYLVCDARIARTGVQIYAGSEVGKPEMETVRVYRPESEVFHQDTMGSFAHRPITIDHPSEAVNSKNWKRYSVGSTGDIVSKDGGFVRVPMTLMDQTAIDAIKAGKRELSCGYTCDLKWEAGTTPEGEPYDAQQTNIRGNHLAIVSAGRAGSDCRIGDEAEKEKPMTLKTVTVDGIPIEVTDQGATVIATLQQRLVDKQSDHDKLVTSHAAVVEAKDKELGTKDAEIEKLKGNQLDDAKLDQLVADRAEVLAKSKAIADGVETTGKSIPDIRRATVAKKLGDERVKDKADAYVEALFDSLAVDAKPDQVRQAIISNDGHKATDSASAHAAMVSSYQDAWKNPKGAA